MKRILCTALTAALTLGLLSGCGSDGGKPGGSTPAAMGRYIEEPGEVLDGVSRLSGQYLDAAGNLVFYAKADDGSVEECTLPAGGGALKRATPAWMAEVAAVRNVSAAPDGTTYILSRDDQGGDLVYRLENGALHPLSIPDLQRGQENGGAMAMPGGSVSVGVGESTSGEAGVASEGGAEGGDGVIYSTTTDGAAPAGDADGQEAEGGDEPAAAGKTPSVNTQFAGGETRFVGGVRALDGGEFLLIFGGSGVSRYDAEGRLLMEYPSGGYIGQTAVKDGKLVTTGADGKSLLIYDLATGTVEAESVYDNLSFTTVVGLDSQGLYLADATGIYRQSQGGTVWERLVDGDLTSLSMPTWTVGGVVSDGEAFTAILTGEDKSQIMRYVYDETTPTLPDKELVIFGLKDSNTIRQAIGEFQRRNPTVRVNFQVMLDENSGATAEDVIRALNTELVAGKGPDLLLLDGLPLESYIEKGVLADLTDQLRALVDGQGLMDNLMGAYQRDGRRYGVPARFTVPVMMGKTEDVARVRSLEDLAALVEAEQGGEPQFLWPSTALYEDGGMLMDYYDACAGGLVSKSGADQAGLANYLNQMLRIQNAERANTPELGEGAAYSIVISSSSGSNGFEVLDMGSMNLGQGKARFHIQELIGQMGLHNILQNLDEDGWALDTLFGGGSFTPVGGVGIVASTQQRELADAFVELLVSTTVQDNYLYDGFPVNGDSLDKLVNKATEETGQDDMGFRALCDALDTPILSDQVVRDAAAAQAKALSDGTITPEQAAAQVVESTELYRAE